MSKTRVKTRVVSDRVEVLTIWDNFERHCRELRAVGAGDKDLAPLKEAAAEVAAEEEKESLATGKNPALNKADLADLTAPRICANGWEIAPPSLSAKRWASTAVLKTTGGVAPNDPVGCGFAILAALWVLRAWGAGRRDEVMQTIAGPGRLADLIPRLQDDSPACDMDALSDDYVALMGLAKKKSLARQRAESAYNKALSSIRMKCSGSSTTGSSLSTSPPAAR